MPGPTQRTARTAGPPPRRPLGRFCLGSHHFFLVSVSTRRRRRRCRQLLPGAKPKPERKPWRLVLSSPRGSPGLAMPSSPPPPRPSLRCHLPLPLLRVVRCSCVDVDLINLYVPPRDLIRLPGPRTSHLLYFLALEPQRVLSGKYNQYKLVMYANHHQR